MTTPTHEQIQQYATTLYMKNQAQTGGYLGETLPELTELKESGYWEQARYELMCSDMPSDIIESVYAEINSDKQTIEELQKKIKKLERELKNVKDSFRPVATVTVTAAQPAQPVKPETVKPRQPQPVEQPRPQHSLTVSAYGTVRGSWALVNVYLLRNGFSKQADGVYVNGTGQRLRVYKVVNGSYPFFNCLGESEQVKVDVWQATPF
jgi:hypothetical protein